MEKVRIRLDVLGRIIEELDTRAELEEIFGYPVSKSLVIIADNNDLRIEAEKGSLEKEEEEKFLSILDEVIKKHSSKLKEI